MNIEIISIGDEMTTGQRLDTNSQWLSQRCSELGLEVAFHTTVGDNESDNIEAFRIAANRVDLVVATGGLGPTADDLTRLALAKMAGVPLYRDEASEIQVRSIFSRSRRPMPESNLCQADFPMGSLPIPNPNGTAPGIDMTVSSGSRNCQFFCLPGVPAEMVEMWNAYVGPRINARIDPGSQLFMRVIHCFGAGESHIESMLPGIIDRNHRPRVGITASLATISLRIQARAKSMEDANSLIQPVESLIRDTLGNLVFGVDDETLEGVVASQLMKHRSTLAILDYGLFGEPAAWLAQTPCGSQVLKGSLAIPSTSAHELDSDQLIRQAEEVRNQFNADFGLSIGPLQERESVIQYLVSLVGPDLVAQEEFAHAGYPTLRVNRSIKQVLNFLRLKI